MPNWIFHNNWAERLDISRAIANWVNKREDLPKFDQINDSGLQKFKENIPDNLPTYSEMAKMGGEYLRAWILHLLIDELEDFLEPITKLEAFPDNKIVEQAMEGLQFSSLLQILPDTGLEAEVKTFFINNLREISIGIYSFLKSNNPYVEMNFHMQTEASENNIEMINKNEEYIKNGNIRHTDNVLIWEYICPKCGYIWQHKLTNKETVLDPLKSCPQCFSNSE